MELAAPRLIGFKGGDPAICVTDIGCGPNGGDCNGPMRLIVELIVVLTCCCWRWLFPGVWPEFLELSVELIEHPADSLALGARGCVLVLPSAPGGSLRNFENKQISTPQFYRLGQVFW